MNMELTHPIIYKPINTFILSLFSSTGDNSEYLTGSSALTSDLLTNDVELKTFYVSNIFLDNVVIDSEEIDVPDETAITMTKLKRNIIKELLPKLQNFEYSPGSITFLDLIMPSFFDSVVSINSIKELILENTFSIDASYKMIKLFSVPDLNPGEENVARNDALIAFLESDIFDYKDAATLAISNTEDPIFIEALEAAKERERLDYYSEYLEEIIQELQEG